MRESSRLRAAQLVAAAVVALTALVIGAFVLLDSRQRLAGTSSIRADRYPVAVAKGSPVCIHDVLVPADSSAFRVQAAGAATVTMSLSSPTTTIARVTRTARLPRPGYVVFPLPRQSSTTAHNDVCLAARSGSLRLAGMPSVGLAIAPTVSVGGEKSVAGIAFQFMKPGKETGLSLLGTVFHRASLFKPAWIGPWTFYFGLAMFLLLIGAAVVVLVRSALLQPGLWTFAAVTAIAFLSAVAWTIVTPAFQAPDEYAHYAYVESLVQRGDAPCTAESGCGRDGFTPEERVAINYTTVGVALNTQGRPPWTSLQEAQWRSEEDSLQHPRDGGGGYTQAAGYSPVYYATEIPAYLIGSGGSIFDRLWFMRLLSALMGAASALFAALFVRELAPGVTWPAPAAGLAVAFQPMFAFVSGSINNDNLLILSATAEFYLLARALQRGLTVPLGLAIGAALAVGVAAKPTMYGLVPAVVLTVAWVAYRDRSQHAPRELARPLAAVLGSFTALALLRYGLLQTGGGAEGVASQNERGDLSYFLSYMWQWYLPPLSSMQDLFPLPDSPAYDIFFQGFWAKFGHLDTAFSDSVYRVLAVLSALVIASAAIAVWRHDVWKRTIPKLLLGLVGAAGITLAVQVRSYLAWVSDRDLFAQGRYLLPAIAVFGALIALGALGFGRRRGVVAATAIIVALAFFDLFSMGLTLQRYYT